MLTIFHVFAFFWLIRTVRAVLFWIYLWQLKEYHIGRFVDHIKTDKGKKLIFGFLPLFKVILLVFLVNNYYLPSRAGIFMAIIYVLLIIYFLETIKFIVNRFKRPVWTPKTLFLASITILFVGLSLLLAWGRNNITVLLLIFDILLPLAVSAIVLLFQPFFVLKRNRILKKAKNKIKNFKNLIVIGITGSYGKTSTKEFLTTILSDQFNILSTKDHQNSEIGIAKTILDNLEKKHQIFIVEMGAYKKGGIKLLCDITNPKIGIVTGVNQQHLATFGSMENLLSAEGGRELADSLPKDGKLIINGDNKHCIGLYRKIVVSEAQIATRVYSVNGKIADSDIWAEEISVKKDSLDFVAVTKEGEMVHFNINVLGMHNIQNLLAAILTAKTLGMSLEKISSACQKIKPEQAGITLKKGVGGINIIDSSYSSNPDGVMADLDYLKVCGEEDPSLLDVRSARKIVIMPCLIELGRESVQIHRQIGQKIDEICDMAIITTKERFQDIKTGAKIGGLKAEIIFSESPKEIFNIITTFCKEGDNVLLEGRVPNELIKLLIL